MGILLRMIGTTDAFKSNQSIDFNPARTKADLLWKTTTDFSFLDSQSYTYAFFFGFSLKFQMRYLCSSTCGGKGRQCKH